MYSLNLSCFDNITTEAQAYILGYFYMRGSGRLQLNQDFLSVLHMIKKELSCDAPIHTYGENVVLNITRQDFRDNLMMIGCKPNRFINSHIPNFSPELIGHFFRAIYENYGRTYYTKQKYLNVSLTLNENFATQFRAHLKQNYGITMCHLYRHEHLNSLTLLINRHDESIRFLNYIYSGASQFYCQVRKFQEYQ